MTCCCMGPQNGQPKCPCMMRYEDDNKDEFGLLKPLPQWLDSKWQSCFMEPLKLLPEGSPLLLQKSTDWVAPRPPTELVEGLTKIVEEHGALGISAIQVGVPLRVMLVGESIKQGVGVSDYATIINPRNVEISGLPIKMTEGCLSFPGLWLTVERNSEVSFEYDEFIGSITPITKSKVYSGIRAQCFLHELEHMDGILFTSKVSRLERDIAFRKRLKRKRNG